MTNKLFFLSPTRGKLTIEGLKKEITNFIISDQDSHYRLVIGTDSLAKKINGVSECSFVTAIVIQRIGKGARYFWQKDKETIPSVLRERMYNETSRSLAAAEAIVPELREVIENAGCELEIHIDVGEKGKTREMLKEVVGMVNGNGYTAKTKPDSWGASSVADKYT